MKGVCVCDIYVYTDIYRSIDVYIYHLLLVLFLW